MSGIVKSIGKLVGGILGTTEPIKAQTDMLAKQTQAQLQQAAQTRAQTQALERQNLEIARQTEAARKAAQEQQGILEQQQRVAQEQLEQQRIEAANRAALEQANQALPDIAEVNPGGTAALEGEDPLTRRRRKNTGGLASTLGVGV